MSEAPKSPTSFANEDFVNESLLKSSQQQFESECDKNRFKNDFDKESSECDEKAFKKSRSERNSSDSETEIDLTTTGSPKDFVLVNGCIDFSNNNNNVNNKSNEKWAERVSDFLINL